MQQQITINTTDTQVSVVSPYNTKFVARARALAGKWDADGKAWVFDRRDEERVRKLCMEVYGEDGRVADTCTLRVTYVAGDYADQGPLTVHGRIVARAYGRDSGAKLGEGVVLLSGGFGSGGSMKNWTTRCRVDNTIVLLRDFPRSQAMELVNNSPDEFAIEPEVAPVNCSALTEERDRLLARIAEIDAILAEAGPA